MDDLLGDMMTELTSHVCGEKVEEQPAGGYYVSPEQAIAELDEYFRRSLEWNE